MLNYSPWLKLLLFQSILAMTSVGGCSSPSVPATWLWLEMNLLSFMMMVFSQGQHKLLIKYFFTQAIFSTVILATFFITLNFPLVGYSNYLFTLMVLAKLGVPPFASWFLKIMNSLHNPLVLFALLTIQKIIPLYMLTISPNYLFYPLLILSMTSIMLWTFASSTLNWLLAVSSVFNSLWMVLASSAFSLTLTFLALYSLQILLLLFMSSSKLLMSPHWVSFFKTTPLDKMSFILVFMSMSGIPPLLGFMPKFAVLSQLINTTQLAPLILPLLVVSLFVLLMYVKYMMSSGLSTSSRHSSSTFSHSSISYSSLTILLIAPSLASLW